MSRNIPVCHNNSMVSPNHSIATVAATNRDEASIAAWNFGKELSKIPGNIYHYFFPAPASPAVNIQKLRENILENFRKALAAHKSASSQVLIVLIQETWQSLPPVLKTQEQLATMYELFYQKLKEYLRHKPEDLYAVVLQLPEWCEFHGVGISSEVQDAETEEREEENFFLTYVRSAFATKEVAQQRERARIYKDLVALRDKLIFLGRYSSKALVKKVVKDSAVNIEPKYRQAMEILKSKSIFEQKKYLAEHFEVLEWIKAAALSDGHASSYLGSMLSTDDSTLGESIPFLIQGILQFPNGLGESEGGEKMRIVLLRVALMRCEQLGLSYLNGFAAVNTLQEMQLLARFTVDFCAFLQKHNDEHYAFDLPELAAKGAMILANTEKFLNEGVHHKALRR